MKKALILLFLFATIGVSMSDAQFSGLGKSLLKSAQNALVKGASNAVERKVEQKATEQADSILTRSLDNLGKAKKDSVINSADADRAIKSTDSIRTVLKAKAKTN